MAFEAGQLIAHLANYVNTERDSPNRLWALLVDALARLAKAYELDRRLCH
jgi:hypothetical protein